VTLMRAVRLRPGSAPRLVRVPRPDPGRGEVRVAVAYTGICHTDLHFIDGERAPRMADEVTLGHEMAGHVEDVGTGVEGWAIGDPVVVNPMGERAGQSVVLDVHVDGSWADHVVVPADMLVAADGIPLEHAAVLPDAVSTSWAAIRGTADVRAGESAGVWGIGGLGHHAVQLLRLVGAAPIVAVDPDPSARARALEAGADASLDPRDPHLGDRIRAVSGPSGLDVAFDFVGAAAVHQQAFDAVGRYGRVVLVGVADGDLVLRPGAALVRLGKQVLGHYAEVRHLRQVVDLVRLGRLDLTRSVSTVLDLDDFEQGLRVLRTRLDDPVRVLLTPAGRGAPGSS
jgi:threonine dehydrogenase-like Zn-dependent dehydrogenase